MNSSHYSDNNSKNSNKTVPHASLIITFLIKVLSLYMSHFLHFFFKNLESVVGLSYCTVLVLKS